MQADACGGDDEIYLNSGGTINEVACWAHARRYWYKAREESFTRAPRACSRYQTVQSRKRHARTVS
jgi:hypothetical protein